MKKNIASKNDAEFVDVVGFSKERVVDTQYRDALASILKDGQDQETRLMISDPETGKDRAAVARYKEMVVLEYDLSNGVPLITERNLKKASRGAIAEIIAFINGAQTLDELDSYGVPRIWWEPQITEKKTAKRGLEPGELGPASYGPVYHDFPTPKGPFNQVKAVVDQIRSNPELRTHVMTSFYGPLSFRAPGYEQKVVVVPCHGSLLHFRVNNGELTLKHIQRSGDMPVGVQFNLIQYTALALMVAQATGYKAAKYIHVISDAHIYENQFELVKTFLDRKPNSFPTLLLNKNVPIDEEFKMKSGKEYADIFAFRADDFLIDEYDAHDNFRMPTAV